MKTLTIKSNQYISDIMSFLPTNSIITKPCGKGLTECEIRAKRHSVIVEPNKPVIHGKCLKHKEMLGVTKGVDIDSVLKYVESRISHCEFIKIMVTPESFYKVEKGLEAANIDIMSEVFMLFDECHKVIEEQGFRSSVSLPMDLFFKCEKKALASATPMKMRDKRFEGFEEINIEEEEEGGIDIDVCVTNNVVATMSDFIGSHQDEPLFVFLNSTDLIFDMIGKMQLENVASVFCAERSVEKLRLLGMKNAHSVWDITHMGRVNFMTSRFYSALDIDLDFLPNVLIVSHVKAKEHTKVNPSTSVVQIAGRFRAGIASITHITNVNPEFEVRQVEDIEDRISYFRHSYEYVKMVHDSTTTNAERDAMNDLMQVHPYHTLFMNEDGSENTFAIDNYVEDKMIKMNYHDSEGVKMAYQNVRKLNVKFREESHVISDDALTAFDKNKFSIVKIRQLIVEQLRNLGECDTLMAEDYRNELALIDPLVVEAYYKLSKKELNVTKLMTKELREAIVIHDYKEKQRGDEILKLIRNSFPVKRFYSAREIRTEIKRIYKLFKVIPPKAVSSHTIKDYFFCEEKRTSKERGYYLHEAKL